MERQTFTVSKISCGHCVAAIQKELIQMDGVVRVDGEPKDKSVSVEWEAPATQNRIEEKLAEIGYPAG